MIGGVGRVVGVGVSAKDILLAFRKHKGISVVKYNVETFTCCLWWGSINI